MNIIHKKLKLYQNKNINNNINNYNIAKFNNNQNQIYQFIDNNDDNNYDPTPSLKRYLEENRNKTEYKFLSDEQLSNNTKLKKIEYQIQY